MNKIGDRVIISNTEGVCSYLYGHTGIVESIKEFYPGAHPEIIHRIKLDIHAWSGAQGWTPLESIGLEAHQFQPSVLKNKASSTSLLFEKMPYIEDEGMQDYRERYETELAKIERAM